MSSDYSRRARRPAERAVRIDGSAFRIFSSGPERAAGPPFVLVHGIGMSHRYFARLHDELVERGERVHSVDLPGFGGVPKPPRDLDIAAMARGLGAALDAFGVPRAIFVGQSMGTQWVTELAVQRPDLTASLALIGPVADDRHRTVPRQSIALGLDMLRETPGANLLVLADYIRCGPPWYLAQLRHMLAYPTQERVRALAAPVLVLRGGRDPIAGSQWARRVTDAADSATLAIVPGHAHNVQHSAPRAVASALVAFAGTGRRGAR
ncbi:alpha/beta fold hydrolase [Microbacterium sp. RD1]|uniref:alpha/beta fold hydrolase n=1 Tax=Microbacterium sp. RD1 TaxID=3457313 RepID=UPI003FA5642A